MLIRIENMQILIKHRSTTGITMIVRSKL